MPHGQVSSLADVPLDEFGVESCFQTIGHALQALYHSTFMLCFHCFLMVCFVLGVMTVLEFNSNMQNSSFL